MEEDYAGPAGWDGERWHGQRKEKQGNWQRHTSNADARAVVDERRARPFRRTHRQQFSRKRGHVEVVGPGAQKQFKNRPGKNWTNGRKVWETRGFERAKPHLTEQDEGREVHWDNSQGGWRGGPRVRAYNKPNKKFIPWTPHRGGVLERAQDWQNTQRLAYNVQMDHSEDIGSARMTRWDRNNV